jgi:hypothetical protein
MVIVMGIVQKIVAGIAVIIAGIVVKEIMKKWRRIDQINELVVAHSHILKY